MFNSTIPRIPVNVTLSFVLKLCAADVVITAGLAWVIALTVACVPCAVTIADAVT